MKTFVTLSALLVVAIAYPLPIVQVIVNIDTISQDLSVVEVPIVVEPKPVLPEYPESIPLPEPIFPVLPQPEEAAPIEPEVAAPEAPGDAVPVEPEVAASEAPGGVAPEVPEVAAPVVPEVAAPEQPEVVAPVQPVGEEIILLPQH